MYIAADFSYNLMRGGHWRKTNNDKEESQYRNYDAVVVDINYQPGK
jgi:hypothetical protein